MSRTKEQEAHISALNLPPAKILTKEQEARFRLGETRQCKRCKRLIHLARDGLLHQELWCYGCGPICWEATYTVSELVSEWD